MSDTGKTGAAQRVTDDALAGVLMAHWAHLDSNMWSRAQYVSAAQLAGLGGGYTLNETGAAYLAKMVLGLAFLVTLVSAAMMKRDTDIREATLTKLRVLLGTQWSESFDPVSKLGPVPLKGRALFGTLLFIFLTADALLWFALWRVSTWTSS